MSDKKRVIIHYLGEIITKDVEAGTSLEEILDTIDKDNKEIIVGAKIKNEIEELTSKIEEECDIEFFDITDKEGNRIYQRGLCFIYIKAVREILSEASIIIEHSLSKGLYSEIQTTKNITEEDIKAIKTRMKEMIDEDILFEKKLVSSKEAIQIFKEQNMNSQAKLLEFINKEDIKVYNCGWMTCYFYGHMVPSTRYIKNFDVVKYQDGIILRFPIIEDKYNLPQFKESRKIAKIFKEAEDWGDIMNLSHISDLNERIETDTYNEIIRITEALQEKKIGYLADKITEKKKRIILIAGPSSSGKTTFAARLSIQLKANGLHPIRFSTDDYFVDREKTPLDENGNKDYESLDALDLELFNQNLKDLLAGKVVDLPSYNFIDGIKEFGKHITQISNDQMIIIEGIHGLNEKLTEAISKDDKFKIYISALTQLNIDSYNRIPTTDSRLIRRIVRDYNFRGHSAKETLASWESVRRGEEKNIFPFQEEADEVFDSALVYELAVLKKYVVPLLQKITKDDEQYIDAHRLLKFFEYFRSIESETAILNNSIIKEFIGGSCFSDYYN